MNMCYEDETEDYYNKNRRYGFDDCHGLWIDFFIVCNYSPEHTGQKFKRGESCVSLLIYVRYCIYMCLILKIMIKCPVRYVFKKTFCQKSVYR